MVKKRARSKVLAATGLAAVSAMAVGPAEQSHAVTSGYSLPLDQTPFNGNYNGSSGPMDYGVCHHAACNNVGETFWAVDLFQGLNATIYTWTGGYVQYNGWDSGCGNRIRWGTYKGTNGTNPGTSYMYCHGNSLNSGLTTNTYVGAGGIVMKMGSTGSGSNGVVHLHFDYRWLIALNTWGADFNGYCTRKLLDRINNNLAPNPEYGYTSKYGIINGNCT